MDNSDNTESRNRHAGWVAGRLVGCVVDSPLHVNTTDNTVITHASADFIKYLLKGGENETGMWLTLNAKQMARLILHAASGAKSMLSMPTTLS